MVEDLARNVLLLAGDVDGPAHVRPLGRKGDGVEYDACMFRLLLYSIVLVAVGIPAKAWSGRVFLNGN